ncbi:MAG: D-amino acid dehydrogenase [Pseudomonadota bacterium]
MTHIAIIGAGITGTTTAWSLLKRGFDVTLIDKARYAGMETSFANGGQLSASNAEVWNSWGNVKKGIRWMFKKDAPLLMNPMPSWHKYSWMAEFMANIPRYEENTVQTVRMAIAAREHMFDMAREAAVDFNHEKRGILHIYKTKKEFDQAERVSKLYAKGGLDRRAVTPDEIREIAPTMVGEFFGGLFTESDSTGDIHKFSVGLAEAVERHGGRFLSETEVTSLSTDALGTTVRFKTDGKSHSETFDGVVVCAGVASKALASQLGDRVNIYPVKGYSITVELHGAENQAAAPWVSLLDDDAKIVTSRLGRDRFRVAGTAEFAGYNKDIRAERIKPLVDWCNRYFPGMSTEKVVPWAGLRPMMPDMMPRVGRGKKPGVFYNTGHGHLGWTLSAVTAEMVAADVEGQLGKPLHPTYPQPGDGDYLIAAE